MFAHARETRKPRPSPAQHVALPRNAGYFFPAAAAAGPRTAGTIEALARALADQPRPKPDRAPIPALYADWAELVAGDLGCAVPSGTTDNGRPGTVTLPRASNGRLDLSSLRGETPRSCGWLAEALGRAQRRLLISAPAQGLCAGTAEAASAWARRQVSWSWQWLVLNQFLPTIADDWILAEVVRDGAPLYRQFRKSMAPGLVGDLPVPVEFSCAAFGFVASMARPGHAAQGNAVASWIAALRVLDPIAAAVGNATGPAPGLARLNGTPHRPLHRHQRDTAERRHRDLASSTTSAPACGSNCPAHRPASTGCGRTGHRPAPHLAQLAWTDRPGDAIRTRPFHQKPPVVHHPEEAELRRHLHRLGALGSRLVAETLVGIIQCDPTSYWQAGGLDRGAGTPTPRPKRWRTGAGGLEEWPDVAAALPRMPARPDSAHAGLPAAERRLPCDGLSRQAVTSDPEEEDDDSQHVQHIEPSRRHTGSRFPPPATRRTSNPRTLGLEFAHAGSGSSAFQPDIASTARSSENRSRHASVDIDPARIAPRDPGAAFRAMNPRHRAELLVSALMDGIDAVPLGPTEAGGWFTGDLTDHQIAGLTLGGSTVPVTALARGASDQAYWTRQLREVLALASERWIRMDEIVAQQTDILSYLALPARLGPYAPWTIRFLRRVHEFTVRVAIRVSDP
ncbi:MAG: hypothetical protein ACE368_14815 [Paracoccaceae bacterium]